MITKLFYKSIFRNAQNFILFYTWHILKAPLTFYTNYFSYGKSFFYSTSNKYSSRYSFFFMEFIFNY